MRKFRRVLLPVALVALVAALVSGTALAAWGFAFPISVADTSSTDRAYVPVLTGVTGSSLVDSGYMTATGTDTNMQIGTTSVPYMLSTTQVATVAPTLNAGGRVTFNMYTGYSPVQTAFDIITGSGGYITVSDDALIMRPDGAGTYTEFEDLVGAATHWEAVDEVTHDDAATHVGSDVLDARDTFSLSDPSVLGGATISKIIVYEWVREEGTGDDDFYIMIRSGSTDYFSDQITGLTDTWVLESWEWATDPNTGVAWTTGGLNALEAGGKITTGVDITQVYVAVIYSPSLELGNNFEIEQKGYVDTSAGDGKNLIRKPYAFKTYISAEGSITSTISSELTFGLDSVPDSAGDYTGITTLVGASTHWEAVDDPPGNPDDDTTYVSTTGTSQEKDAYNLEDGFIPDDAAITAVIVHFRFENDVAGTSYAQPFLRLGTDETAGTEESETGNWTSFSETLARPGGGSWQASDINNLQVAIGLKGSQGTTVTSCTQVYVEVVCILAPNASGSYTNIASQEPGSGEHWDKVDELSPDDTTTYVYTQAITQQKDAYNLQDASIPSGAVIDSVTVYFRHRISNDTYWSKCQPFLRLGGSETAGTEDSNGSVTWRDVSETLARPGGGDWQGSDFENLQVAIGLYSTNSGYQAQCTQVYVEIAYTCDGEVKAVTATGVSSGVHTIKTTADGTNLKIYVDDVEKDSVALSGVSVPDNANDWMLMRNDVMHYMEYYKHTVSATEVVWYQPTGMITATTLPDRDTTDGTQNGTITWGSNSDLTVAMGAIASYEATSSTATAEEISFETPEAGIPSGWFGGGDITGLPFYQNFTEVSSSTGMPVRTIYIFLIFGVALAMGYGTFVAFKPMLFSFLVVLLVLWAGSSMNIVPGWIIFGLIVAGIGIIYMRRQV